MIFFGKAISNLKNMLLLEIIILPVYSFLYQVPVFLPGFLVVVFLGSWGYVAVGTLLSAMVIQVRTREILLPILLFPLVLPVLLSAIKASEGFLALLPIADISTWLNLLLVYDLIFTAVAFMVFDFVVED